MKEPSLGLWSPVIFANSKFSLLATCNGQGLYRVELRGGGRPRPLVTTDYRFECPFEAVAIFGEIFPLPGVCEVTSAFREILRRRSQELLLEQERAMERELIEGALGPGALARVRDGYRAGQVGQIVGLISDGYPRLSFPDGGFESYPYHRLQVVT